MAWCPHCNENRPIQRQSYDGMCPYCIQGQEIEIFGHKTQSPHNPKCRGPVTGALDVCVYCNTPVFAKALDKQSYEAMAKAESNIVKKAECFVVTATMGNDKHPIVKDMRLFRDQILIEHDLGRRFILQYYIYGPRLAARIGQSHVRRLISYFLFVGPAHLIVKPILFFHHLRSYRVG